MSAHPASSGHAADPVDTAHPQGPTSSHGSGSSQASGLSQPYDHRGRARPLRILGGVIGLSLTVWLIGNLFLAIAYYPEFFAHSRILMGAIALVAGVGGAMVFFRFLNLAIEGLPSRLSEGLIPYAFLLPGFSLMALMLIYPTIQTIVYSFANDDSTAWVGFENYRTIFQSGEFWQSIFNNVLWILIVPFVTVAFGLAVAVMADKLSPRGEKIAKSTIFLPMAISFVGASTIWSLVYAYNNPGDSQTGLLNAVWVGLGGDPHTWLSISSGRLNSLFLMIILIWLQTGFAMILLSSAIKGVPEDTIEAGRVDGASDFRIFWQIVLPQIKGTMLAVFITVLILVLKVFDIIYVMTNGRDNTNVIANLFFNKLFASGQAGIASAIVVVLLVAIIPILIYQVKAFRDQEAQR
ncbi:carbohydrate ABC transporter permease [Devriesea agamarum]|uniref:carbohydrate ABC transporter permease n=1 Tax=Devriesea agamarum TaxID=472569 RepID=UPI0009FD4216|nr:sugar ABC transporter permease [Devriesea agamarum]